MGSTGHKAPSLRPAAAPLGPVATATAAAGSASIATVMSAVSVTSFGLLASCAQRTQPRHPAARVPKSSWLARSLRDADSLLCACASMTLQPVPFLRTHGEQLTSSVTCSARCVVQMRGR